jgi:hypothetical protein
MPADESKPTNPTESKSLSEARMTSDLLDGFHWATDHQSRIDEGVRVPCGSSLAHA